MLEIIFNEVYEKFKMNFYKNIFQGFEEREANLSTAEVFCVEVVHALGKPTIGELTDFLQISQPNGAYRVSSLVRKGYLKKIQSQEDKREFYLEVTDKFYYYYNVKNEYIDVVLGRLAERFSKEDIEKVEEVLTVMSKELMPEVTNFIKERDL